MYNGIRYQSDIGCRLIDLGLCKFFGICLDLLAFLQRVLNVCRNLNIMQKHNIMHLGFTIVSRLTVAYSARHLGVHLTNKFRGLMLM